MTKLVNDKSQFGTTWREVLMHGFQIQVFNDMKIAQNCLVYLCVLSVLPVLTVHLLRMYFVYWKKVLFVAAERISKKHCVIVFLIISLYGSFFEGIASIFKFKSTKMYRHMHIFGLELKFSLFKPKLDPLIYNIYIFNDVSSLYKL